MAFLDEIGKKISQTSQGMVQKTKDTAESMRLGSAISDEEKRIQSLYLAIGQRYFELHADSYEPELEELVLSIKEANTKIANYSEQIKRLKGIVRCPNCNGEVAYGAPFCSHCGSRMPVESDEPAVESKVRRCKKCGLPLPDGAVFCTNCGTASPLSPEEANIPRCSNCNSVLEEGVAFCTNCGAKATVAAPAPVVEEIPTPVVEETPAPVVVEAPVVEETPAPVVEEVSAPVAEEVSAEVFCTGCGIALPAEAMFCTNCGTKVEAAPAAAAPAERHCTNCGVIVPEGAGFCTNCGQKL